MIEINQDAVELIRRVYGDCNGLKSRSLDFKSEGFRDFVEFSAALRMIGRYNEFNPDAVIEKLAPIWVQLMDVKIAREGSPALYIGVPYWSSQAIGWVDGVSSPFTFDQRRAMLAKVREALQGLEIDELDETGAGFRVWWD